MDCSLPGSSIHGICVCVCVCGVPLKGRYRTEDEMVGWHHQLPGHEFQQVLGVGDGQESLACCSPAVHGVAKSRTRLSDFTFTFHFHALEKEMAAHSSVLAWRIPGMGEPGGLPSMGSHRVGHD